MEHKFLMYVQHILLLYKWICQMKMYTAENTKQNFKMGEAELDGKTVDSL